MKSTIFAYYCSQISHICLYQQVLRTLIKQKYSKGRLQLVWFATLQPFQKLKVDVSCGNLLHRDVVMMQEEAAQIMRAVTKALLTITTEG